MTTDPQPAPTQGEAPSAQPALDNTPRVPPQQAAPEPAAPPTAAPPPLPPQHRLKRTRTSGIWVAVGFFAVILLLLSMRLLRPLVPDLGEACWGTVLLAAAAAAPVYELIGSGQDSAATSVDPFFTSNWTGPTE